MHSAGFIGPEQKQRPYGQGSWMEQYKQAHEPLMKYYRNFTQTLLVQLKIMTTMQVERVTRETPKEFPGQLEL